jgi:hypothetical protein
VDQETEYDDYEDSLDKYMADALHMGASERKTNSDIPVEKHRGTLHIGAGHSQETQIRGAAAVGTASFVPAPLHATVR